MKKILACLTITTFLCCLSGIASLDDEEPTQPNEDINRSRFQIETGLMEVRTIVTDLEGRIVEGLKKEDFELLENEELQEISHFTVSKIKNEQGRIVAEGTGEVRDKEARLQQVRAQLNQPPVRTILLYVDALHLSFSSLNWVKRALHGFIDEHLTDQDLVAFTSSETLGVAQQFTRDRRILRHAVEQMRFGLFSREKYFTPRLAVEFLENRTEAIRLGIDVMRQEMDIVCPCSMLYTYAYHKASQVLTEAVYSRRHTLEILEHYTEQMKELPGKRMIVVFSDGFTSYSRIGELQNEELENTVNRAVRSGVVIYTIVAKGLQTPPVVDVARRSAARDAKYEALVRCVKRCNNEDEVVECQEECLSEHPVSLSCVEDAFEYENVCDYPFPGTLTSYAESSETEKSNGLSFMATETGGEMYDKTNDLNGALDRALDDNRFFYILSYYVTAPKDDDRFRSIEVRVRDHPEYTVRTPRGFRPSQRKEMPEDTTAKTPQQRLIQAMGNPLPVTDLGVSARADFIETEADDKQVSLTVYFEGDSLHYHEQEQGGVVDLEIVSVIYDSSGNQVEGISSHVQGKLTPDDMAQAKTSGYQFSRRLPLMPGVYQARIGVREEGTNRMGTATTWLEVPELAPDKLEMSSLVLSNPLDMDLVDTEGIDVSDLEQVKMVQGIPMYEQDDIFYYSFRVHPVYQDSDGSDLLLMRELLQRGKPVRTEKWVPIATKQEDTDSKGWFDLDGELDIAELDYGVYELRISVKKDGSDHAVQRTVAFGIL